jgi:uncharacterized protein (TIGR03083 family)
VRDIVAHVVGWGELTLSFKELRHVVRAGYRRRRELGNILDAGNEQQVDDRRDLPTAALIARLRELTPRLVDRRARWGKVGRGIPIYDPVVIGRSNLGFLFNVIFTRDVLMHRIDVARAVQEPFRYDDLDRAMVADVVKDWARRSKADATVQLEGVGSFTAGTGRVAAITGSGEDFARVMTNRAQPSELDLGGDEQAALRWLAIHCPF